MLNGNNNSSKCSDKGAIKMIKAIIQFFYNLTHKKSYRTTSYIGALSAWNIPIGNVIIFHIDKNIIHDITDDRIIKL